MKKYLLSLLCLCVCSFAAIPSAAQNIDPADQPRESGAGWWKDRHNALSKSLKENPCDILFIGDSITHFWEREGKAMWDETFGPFHPANFGISADRTEQVLWRLDDSKLETPRPPKVCVIHIGTNNTGHYKTAQAPEDTAKGIAEIAKRLTGKFPKTEVIILHIFPRGTTVDDPMRVHNEKINSLLDKLKMKRVKVVNINKAFLNADGTFKPGLTNDHLHFTAKGYEVWAKALVPHLKKAFPNIGKTQGVKVPAKA